MGIIISTLLVPFTFALGLTSLFFAFLFERLCVPAELRKANGSTILFVFIAWALSLIPYLYALDRIIHTPHYRDLGATSAFQIMNIGYASQYLGLYFITDLLVNVLPYVYLSLGLFLCCAFSAVKYKKDIPWKKITFFFILSMFLSLIIFAFRVSWGIKFLNVSRYDVFPVWMLSVIYALLINPFLNDKKELLANPGYKFIFYLLGFMLISFGGTIRYTTAEKVAVETASSVQRFNGEFKNAFSNYLKEYPSIETIYVKNSMIFFPLAPSLETKRGFNQDISRYTRPLSFYAQYVLPAEVRKKIVWGESTDKTLLDYLKAEPYQSQYQLITALIK